MDERFAKMKCPNCGNEMKAGTTIQAYNHPLIWVEGKSAVTYWDAVKLRFSKDEKQRAARRFTSRFRTKPSYFPAWCCDSCGLMVVDTKTEMEEA